MPSILALLQTDMLCYNEVKDLDKKAKVQKIAASLNVIDDALFQKMAEDAGFCEELISAVLKQKVMVKSVTPQNSIKNLQGRSVVLDALCILEDGRSCNVEVQKANDDNHEKRVRYNTSCITANIVEPGEKFEKIPDVIGIFISQFDVFGKGKTIYHIDRIMRETGEMQDNGLHEIYVNAKIDDGSDIAGLMRIFKEQEAYDFEKFPKISQRKKHFIKNEGGNNEMCEVIDNFLKEEAKETARRFLENGVDYAVVRNCISSVPDEELKSVYEEVIQSVSDSKKQED